MPKSMRKSAILKEFQTELDFEDMVWPVSIILFRATEKSLFLFQTMAILEILHPIVGLVKTSVITTMFQGIVFTVVHYCNVITVALSALISIKLQLKNLWSVIKAIYHLGGFRSRTTNSTLNWFYFTIDCLVNHGNITLQVTLRNILHIL